MTDQLKVLVTERGSLTRNVEATTPPGLPDLCVVVISPLKRVLIRTLRTYLQALLGFLGLVAVMPLPGTDPTDPLTLWNKLVLAAGFALAPAVVALLQNVLEMISGLDESQPELRG